MLSSWGDKPSPLFLLTELELECCSSICQVVWEMSGTMAHDAQRMGKEAVHPRHHPHGIIILMTRVRAAVFTRRHRADTSHDVLSRTTTIIILLSCPTCSSVDEC